MSMKEYIVKDGKKLRLGYTTGSCAAAASKAAAWMLLTGMRKEKIQINTPKGITLDLDVLQISTEDNLVSCAIEKDSGDVLCDETTLSHKGFITDNNLYNGEKQDYTL